MAGAGSSASGARRDKVVVTGARGFLGAAVMSAFVADGRRCEGWVRDGPLAPDGTLRALGHLADTDATTLRDALADASAVVHLAGRAHLAGAEALRDAAFERDNVVATARLAGAARAAGVPRFVHVSSVKVNGEATRPGHPFHVDDVPAPADAYARSKWRAEQALHDALGGSSTAACVMRIPMAYGPGARANFGALVAAVRAGWPLPLASIANRRHLLGIDNLVSALRAALDASVAIAGTYFVADADAVSTPQLVEAIARALGTAPRQVPVPVWGLRLAGRVTGRSAAIERLAGSLEVDTRPFEAATGWRPAPFRLDAAAVAPRAESSRAASA